MALFLLFYISHMSRIPRGLILQRGLQTHKMWRGHNKEGNISSTKDREAYLKVMNKEIDKKNQSNELNALTLMPNHTHEIFHINDEHQFSNMMRNHHSRYGVLFNKRHQRQGKVAYERPKTCLIEDDRYSMLATFYIHANPLKSGIVKNASNYKWSTHRLYAYGKREKWMKNVRFPDWYMDLGRTFEERQKKYRGLFDAYLRDRGLIEDNLFNRYFYGHPLWIMEGKKRITQWSRKNRSKDPP